MKKNKSYIFIILLIAVLILGVGASCNLCEALGLEEPDERTPANNTASTIADTQATTELIHGMEPIKVHGRAKDPTKDTVVLQFWNVGKLGGDDYSSVYYLVNGKEYNGYFTGGPGGEFFLKGQSNGNNEEIHAILMEGKKFVSDDGYVVDIENPDAFDGWIVDEGEFAGESTQWEEATAETEETTDEEKITTEDEKVDQPLTNNDLAGSYTATVTDSTGYTFKSGYTIIPSGSSGGTFDGNPYTFSGDTLTYSVDRPDQRSTGSFKFTKSGNTITAEGTAEGVLIEENGTEVAWKYVITMEKKK